MRKNLPDLVLAGACLTMLSAIALVVVWIPPGQAAAGGIAQKIFYFHVCSAWTAFHAFLLALVCGVGYLVKRTEMWDRLGHVSIEVGMVFCTLVVCTGPIWARPVWGRFWNMEPRLLTFTIMWFTYAGYLLLRNGLAGSARRAPVCAVYSILASVNVPLVYFSVQLVRQGQQLHPPKIGLTNNMRVVLYTTLLGFTLLWIALVVVRYRIEAARDALERRSLATA